ncbi:RE1-silencing transcription factor-like, partial [Tropilaelaps mercedesae]
MVVSVAECCCCSQLCPFYAADQDTVSQHYQLTHCEPIEAALRGVIATSSASSTGTSDSNKQVGMIQNPMARQQTGSTSGPSGVNGGHQQQHQVQQHQVQQHQIPQQQHQTAAGGQLVPVSLQVFQCAQCDYQSHKRGNLNAHVQQMHSEKRPFPCPHCDYRAKTERHLQAHIPTHGGDEPPFRCNQCSFETSDRSALVQHVQAVHESDKVFSCEQCTYKARTSDYLAKHK